MTYEVFVTDKAARQLESAARWYDGFLAAIRLSSYSIWQAAE